MLMSDYVWTDLGVGEGDPIAGDVPMSDQLPSLDKEAFKQWLIQYADPLYEPSAAEIAEALAALGVSDG